MGVGDGEMGGRNTEERMRVGCAVGSLVPPESSWRPQRRAVRLSVCVPSVARRTGLGMRTGGDGGVG